MQHLFFPKHSDREILGTRNAHSCRKVGSLARPDHPKCGQFLLRIVGFYRFRFWELDDVAAFESCTTSICDKKWSATNSVLDLGTRSKTIKIIRLQKEGGIWHQGQQGHLLLQIAVPNTMYHKQFAWNICVLYRPQGLAFRSGNFTGDALPTSSDSTAVSRSCIRYCARSIWRSSWAWVSKHHHEIVRCDSCYAMNLYGILCSNPTKTFEVPLVVKFLNRVWLIRASNNKVDPRLSNVHILSCDLPLQFPARQSLRGWLLQLLWPEIF